MFKILLVQQWHTLSDPRAEEAVRDGLSFRRFCGFPLEVETPDHASIWRFRQTIDKLDLSAALLAETNRQLDVLGLIVKRGTLVDATLIVAAVKRPSYGSGGMNPRDPDARVTIKRKTAHFGYKAHLAGGRRKRVCAAGRDDFGQRPRLSSGGSADPRRRAGLFR
jgi:IS5 family transposase